MIEIHWDYSTGNEVSYAEGRSLRRQEKDFSTHCLEFFSADYPDAVVRTSGGLSISVAKLLDPKFHGYYTSKAIRKSNNLRKMLVAGTFAWRT